MKKGTWDPIAKKYNNAVKNIGDVYHYRYVNPIVNRFLGDVKGKKILDLACGNGYFSRRLEKKGAKVTGVDYSPELIKIAKSFVKDKSKIDYFIGNAANLKFLRNNSFEIIVCNVAFMDIKNIKGTIKECSRLLKKEGKLIFSIKHPMKTAKVDNIDKFTWRLKGYLKPFEKSHKYFPDVKMYHRPTEYYLKELFKNNFFVSNFREVGTKHSNGSKIKNKKLLTFKTEIPTFLIIEAKKYLIDS